MVDSANNKAFLLTPAQKFKARLGLAVAVKLALFGVMATRSADMAFVGIVGGGFCVVGPYGDVSLLLVALCVMPDLVFCCLFTEAIHARGIEEHLSMAVRLGSRARLACILVAKAFLFALLYTVLSNVVECAFSVVFVRDLSVTELVMTSALATAIEWLACSALLLVAGSLAEPLGAVTSPVFVGAAHISTILALASIPYDIAGLSVRYVPSAQSIVAWHDCASFSSAYQWGIYGFGFWWSMAYLLVICAIVSLCLVRSVIRCDFL